MADLKNLVGLTMITAAETKMALAKRLIDARTMDGCDHAVDLIREVVHLVSVAGNDYIAETVNTEERKQRREHLFEMVDRSNDLLKKAKKEWEQSHSGFCWIYFFIPLKYTVSTTK